MTALIIYSVKHDLLAPLPQPNSANSSISSYPVNITILMVSYMLFCQFSCLKYYSPREFLEILGSGTSISFSHEIYLQTAKALHSDPFSLISCF